MTAVNELFKQLTVHCENNDHEKVYAVSNKMLSLPNSQFSVEIFRQSVVTLIQEDQYQLALDQINKLLSNESKKSLLPAQYLMFERLYIEYKMNANDSFEKTFQRVNFEEIESDYMKRALYHLKAQQYYKLGYYSHALEIYKILTNERSFFGDYDGIDLIINQKAIESQKTFFATSNNSASGNSNGTVEDNYDLLFNNSLIEYNERNFSKALKLLDYAKDKVEQSVNELDLFLEVAPMYLQSAYIYQILKDDNKALEVLNQFSSKFEKIFNQDTWKDENVQLLKLIFLNNYYSLLKLDINSHKLLSNLKFPNLIFKLNAKNKLLKTQYYLLKRNEAVLDFKIGKNVSITNDLNYQGLSGSQDVGDIENYDLTILALSSLQESKLVENCDKFSIPSLFYKYLWNKLQSMREPSSELSVNQITAKKLVAGSLLAVQLLVSHSNEKNLNSYLNLAIQLLEALLDLSSIKTILFTKYFGVVTLLLNLYELTYTQFKYFSKFQLVFDMVYQSSQNLDITNQFQYNFLKKITFDFFNHGNLRNENQQKINNIFDKLLSFNPDDTLISILVSNSHLKEQELLSSDILTADLDFNHLITTNLNSLLKDYTETSSSSSFIKKQKRIRKKPQHPSKLDKPLDQERWLPMKDRTYYKVTKKDKKKAKASQNVQGGSADHTTEEATFDHPNAPKKNKKKKNNKKK